MRFYADLHVHSRYSRATSRDATLVPFALQAHRKGLTVLGTGDFTHPAWFAELKENLIPAHIWTPWFSALGASSGYDGEYGRIRLFAE